MSLESTLRRSPRMAERSAMSMAMREPSLSMSMSMSMSMGAIRRSGEVSTSNIEMRVSAVSSTDMCTISVMRGMRRVRVSAILLARIRSESSAFESSDVKRVTLILILISLVFGAVVALVMRMGSIRWFTALREPMMRVCAIGGMGRVSGVGLMHGVIIDDSYFQLGFIGRRGVMRVFGVSTILRRGWMRVGAVRGGMGVFSAIELLQARRTRLRKDISMRVSTVG